MLRTLVDARRVVALAVAGCVGAWGLSTYPFSTQNPFLGLIALEAPGVCRGLAYGYATLWFTTPFYAASLIGSLVAIIVYGYAPSEAARPLPSYPEPESRPTPMLVLGERHFDTEPGRAPAPTWLTVPQRGLYTGIMILGAVGTGKTSACMYPYVDQLLRWRADDEARKVGGLVLEVKGDFCVQVRTMLKRAGRSDDYLEVGLDTGYLLQPAAQRPRPVRRGLRRRHAAEQPVRQVEGTVLAAGVHRPAQVRHPAATHRRGLHDVLGGVPLHPRRQADRPGHSTAHGVDGQGA